MEARFSTFPLIIVTGYRSRAVRRVELIGYFAQFGHPVLFVYFTVKTKAYKVIIRPPGLDLRSRPKGLCFTVGAIFFNGVRIAP